MKIDRFAPVRTDFSGRILLRRGKVRAGFLALLCLVAAGISSLQAQGSEDADVLLYQWSESAVVEGRRISLKGMQYEDASTGEQYSVYEDEAGNPLPEFAKDHQKLWDFSKVYSAQTEIIPFPRQAPVPPVPLAVSERAAAVETVYLPLLDTGKLLEEDAENRSKPLHQHRIGVVRALPAQIRVAGAVAERSQWFNERSGGKFLLGALRAEEAFAVRVHLEDVNLPDGATITLFNTEDPGEVYGPFTQADATESGDFWSPSVFGPGVTVEVVLPPGVDGTSLTLRIGEISHQYAEPKAADTCHNDSTCFPAWSVEASAVARIVFTRPDGTFLCTGALMNDTDTETVIPYFMTAFHCVSTQPVANTIEFYWLYQTPVCNGTPPNVNTVPRTSGGADFLAGMGGNAINEQGNDFAFLRLKNQPPGGLGLLGWTTATPAAGDTLTSIHHPAGDFKRLSQGLRTGATTNFWRIQWSSGVTEGGSSGSPLMNDPTQRLFIGQLWGGSSFCATPTDPDFYGRFSVSFPLISDFLMGDPPVEENESSLSNISTRAKVLTGEEVLIGGFIIEGPDPKTVLIRGRGPSLTDAGVPGALANPTLTLFSGATPLVENDDWGDGGQVTEIKDTGLAPSNALESATIQTLAPGAYTVILTGVGGGTGIGIVEVFDIDEPGFVSLLTNISTRGSVMTGDGVMIGGFVISGPDARQVLLRARGPSLSDSGVNGVLDDPYLRLFSGPTQIDFNDDWQTGPNADEIQSSGLAPSDPLESALLRTLSPGAYTLFTEGFDGSMGIGIVEVIDVTED